MSHPVELKFSSKVCFFEAGLHEARWSFEKLGTWSLCPRRCRELHSSAAAGAESTASVRSGARLPIAHRSYALVGELPCWPHRDRHLDRARDQGQLAALEPNAAPPPVARSAGSDLEVSLLTWRRAAASVEPRPRA